MPLPESGRPPSPSAPITVEPHSAWKAKRTALALRTATDDHPPRDPPEAARKGPMKIVEIREKTMPISSPIRNAYIDFSKMTLSLVAVVTDVVRDGKPVVGYGFNSNGRYGQGTLMRERFIPRLLEAAPDIAARRHRRRTSTRTRSGRRCSPTRSRAGTASARSPSAPSTWPCGTRWPRSRASRCSSCSPSATATAGRTASLRLRRRRLLLPRAGPRQARRTRCAATSTAATRSSR